MIPAEAVEAAAKKLYQASGLTVWDKEDESTRNFYRRNAKSALEAAAPYMMAEAFEQGQKSGLRHTDRLVAAAKIGKPELPGPISLNPYRTPDVV